MKKHISTIILIFVFIIGFLIMLYPFISDYINQKNASRAIINYEQALADMSPEDFTKYFEQADEYNQKLVADPMAFYNPSLVSGYNEALDLTGTGLMGYISISKINVEIPIYHGTAESVLQRSIGHLEGTSLPVGGESTHSVLVGHRGLPSAKLFSDLNELEIGDEFKVYVMNRELTYQVDQIVTVLPNQSQELLIENGEDYCTLLTCTPYGINTHRLLVRGVRIYPENPEVEMNRLIIVSNASPIDNVLVAIVVSVPLLIVAIVLMIIWFRKRDSRS